MKTITVSRSLFARLTGMAEDLKESLMNVCEGFEDDEQISREEIEEWEQLLEQANAALDDAPK